MSWKNNNGRNRTATGGIVWHPVEVPEKNITFSVAHCGLSLDCSSITDVSTIGFCENIVLTQPGITGITPDEGNSIAIGYKAGNAALGHQGNQGANAIAIGNKAGTSILFPHISQHKRSIVLNASGFPFNSAVEDGFHVRPIRESGAADPNRTLYYDVGSGEIKYGLSASPAPAVKFDCSYIVDVCGVWFCDDIMVGTYNKSGGDPPGIAIGDNAGGITGSPVWGGTLLPTNSIAIGNDAGSVTAAFRINSIAIGLEAGKTSQGNGSVAIGDNAGLTNQGNNSVAIGTKSGAQTAITQGTGAVAIGNSAGQDQDNNSVAIGHSAGKGTTSKQGKRSVAIGYEAAQKSQGEGSVAIGEGAGITQGNNSVAIGHNAGFTNQGQNSVAIGNLAGQGQCDANCIIINAGSTALNSDGANRFYVKPVRKYETSDLSAVLYDSNTGEITFGVHSGAGGGGLDLKCQSISDVSTIGFCENIILTSLPATSNSIAIGSSAGGVAAVGDSGSQLNSGISIGNQAGLVNQGSDAVAIGTGAAGGALAQNLNAVAIGGSAGYTGQGGSAIAIGDSAGNTSQGSSAIAIGESAGYTSQGQTSVAIGKNAGNDTQLFYSVALGYFAGKTNQGGGSVAIGRQAAETGQGTASVAIGEFAGNATQTGSGGPHTITTNSICIGKYSSVDVANSINLNASGAAYTGSKRNAAGFYVDPVNSYSSTPLASNTIRTMMYDTGLQQIVYEATGTKTFVIEHPIREDYKLIHSCIEGPQVDLIYRGKIKLEDGYGEINIDETNGMTNGTFEALCRDIQSFTTNETGWEPVRSKVVGNILHIQCKDKESEDTISWMVIGERKDEGLTHDPKTDDEGRLITEQPNSIAGNWRSSC